MGHHILIGAPPYILVHYLRFKPPCSCAGICAPPPTHQPTRFFFWFLSEWWKWHTGFCEAFMYTVVLCMSFLLSISV